MKETDVLVIGSGLAGLVLALELAEKHKVTICSKTDLSTTNSAMAQGGIAAVMSEDDSFDRHVEDTLNAGAGLCDANVVRHVVEQAPDRIQDLMKWGVRFDVQGDQPALTREGGHSVRRILHIADHTGQEVHARLMEKIARASEHPKFWKIILPHSI